MFHNQQAVNWYWAVGHLEPERKYEFYDVTCFKIILLIKCFARFYLHVFYQYLFISRIFPYYFRIFIVSISVSLICILFLIYVLF